MKKLFSLVFRLLVSCFLVGAIISFFIALFSKPQVYMHFAYGQYIHLAVEVIAGIIVIASVLCLIFQNRIYNKLFPEQIDLRTNKRTILSWIKFIGIVVFFVATSSLVSVTQTYTFGSSSSQGNVSETQTTSTNYSINFLSLAVMFFSIMISINPNIAYRRYFEREID